jgi:transcriptional regulator with XRE-family HTH domain
MRLSTYLENHKATVLAEKCGVSRQALYNYAKGKHLPNLRTAEAIEEATEGAVTLYDWTEASGAQSLI